MKARRTTRSISALALLATVATVGCGKDSPGPGASTVSGNVSSAETGTGDTSLDGIQVIARSGGQEVSDLTDASGRFLLTNAPTSDVTVLFRRGGCEASLAVGAVVSSSTLTISDAGVVCTDNPGNVFGEAISEIFQGVMRNDANGPSDSARLCVRLGSNDHTRSVPLQGATIQDRSGTTTTATALRKNDLVEIDGDRSSPGSSFTFSTRRVRIIDQDVRDVCDDDPFT